MVDIDIEKLLSTFNFYNLEVSRSNLSDTIEVLGNDYEKTAYDYVYDVYWQNVNITFDSEQHLIEKIEISFENDAIQYKNYKINFGSKISFSKKTSLDKIFLFLNNKRIPFVAENSEVDFDYLFIVINERIRLTYYLPWKNLIKLTIFKGATS